MKHKRPGNAQQQAHGGPRDFRSIFNSAVLSYRDGRFEESVLGYRRALAFQPGFAEGYYHMGLAYKAMGNFLEAMAALERAVKLKPGYVTARNELGIILSSLGRFDEAIGHYENALALEPGSVELLNNLGTALMSLGRFDESRQCFARAIEISPGMAEAHLNLAQITRFHEGDAELAALESLVRRNDLAPDQTAQAHFALGTALEQVGKYARAFEQIRKGNERKRALVPYDEEATLQAFRSVAASFPKSIFETLCRDGDPSDVPVFVLGMPRSGSTLVEQILASHPRIHAAGELADFELAASAILSGGGHPVDNPEGDSLRRIARLYLSRLPVPPEGKIRIVNKHPLNFMRIGLIRIAFPNAKIIHTLRSPIDTCLSCYTTYFTQQNYYAYNLEELARYYRGYSALMDYWRSVLPAGSMLEVAYEDVVNDLEGQAKRMIEYCGLEWDERCLSFHQTSRPINTRSFAQARQPLFRSSVERWKRYETELAPLLRELGDLAGQPGKAA